MRALKALTGQEEQLGRFPCQISELYPDLLLNPVLGRRIPKPVGITGIAYIWRDG